MRALIALSTVLLASTSAQAAVNLVSNGSFETGIAISGPTLIATDDATSIAGWTVTADGVNYSDDAPGTGWDAADGSRSVELATGTGNGGISQLMSGFTIGKEYRLKFDVSANPYDVNFRPRDARVRFSITGGLPEFYDYTLQNANTASNMMYSTVVYDFIASAELQAVAIQGAVNPFLGYGVVIDNVSVVAVPEASTWAMLIVGFGLVGAAARRRNHAVSA